MNDSILSTPAPLKLILKVEAAQAPWTWQSNLKPVAGLLRVVNLPAQPAGLVLGNPQFISPPTTLALAVGLGQVGTAQVGIVGVGWPVVPCPCPWPCPWPGWSKSLLAAANVKQMVAKNAIMFLVRFFDL